MRIQTCDLVLLKHLKGRKGKRFQAITYFLGSFTNFFQTNYDIFEGILTGFMKKESFGSEDNPLDERAFYQSIFY